MSLAAGCNALWGIDELAYDRVATAGGGAPTGVGGGGAAAGTGGSSVGGSTVVGGGGAGGGGFQDPEVVWLRRWGTSGAQHVESMLVQDTGNLVLAGYGDGAVDFGGGPLPAGGGDDALVVALDENGDHRWSERWGDEEAQRAHAVMGLGGTVPVVGGILGGQMDLFGQIVDGGASPDAFLVRLFDSGMAAYFYETYGGSNPNTIRALAYTTYNINLAGHFQGGLNDMDQTYTSVGGEDVIVARVHQTGGLPAWSLAFGSAQDDRALDIAGATSGSSWVVVVGSHGGAITLPDSQDLAYGGGDDAFVLRLDAGGDVDWARGFGDAADQVATAVAIGADGSVFVAGIFEGSLDLDGNVVTSGGLRDLFVAKLDADGDAVWVRSVGSEGDDEAMDLAIGADGTLWICGAARGDVQFGGRTFSAAGGSDVLVVSFDPQGNPVSALLAGDEADQRATAIGPSGSDLFVAGSFSGTLSVGDASETAVGTVDAFVARLRW